jgi:hypothetical protein
LASAIGGAIVFASLVPAFSRNGQGAAGPYRMQDATRDPLK